MEWNNCGLFSIMNAYYVAHGDIVSKLKVKQEDLRVHLIGCFEQQELTSFLLASTTKVELFKKNTL